MYAHQIENCSILKINGGEGLAKKERFVSLSTVVDKKKKKKKKKKKNVKRPHILKYIGQVQW